MPSKDSKPKQGGRAKSTARQQARKADRLARVAALTSGSSSRDIRNHPAVNHADRR